MDWSAVPFVEYFPSETIPKREDWKVHYIDVVDVLQMNEDQAMASVLCLLRGWALHAVSDLLFRFWMLETDEVVMSLRQYVDIIENMLSLCRKENCYRTDRIGISGKSLIEQKAESENGEAESSIKNSFSEKSEDNFELSVVGVKLVIGSRQTLLLRSSKRNH